MDYVTFTDIYIQKKLTLRGAWEKKLNDKRTKSNFICPVVFSLAYIPNVEAVCAHLS